LSLAKFRASRRGDGRVRHIEVRELWLQDRVARGELKVVKVRGDVFGMPGLGKLVVRGCACDL
jgi:hypothetical protein